jgi:hypothetical protein
MTSAFYSGLASTAAALLKSKGQLLKMWVMAESSYDPVTGTVIPGAETSVSVYGVVSDMPLDQVPGTLIQSGDRKVIVDASGGDPNDFDSIEIGGERNTILNSRVTSPAGTPVIYTVLVRRGGCGHVVCTAAEAR